MMKDTTLLLLCAVISVASAAERNYKKCDRNDPSFNTCLGEAANIYLANLDEEVEGIHNTFVSNSIQVNSGPVQLKVQYNVTQFLNSTHSVNVTINYDVPSRLISGTIKAPHVGYRDLVDVDGTIMNVRFLGRLDWLFHIYDMEASYEAKLQPGTDQKFEVQDVQFNVDKIRKAEITVQDIQAENKAIEAGMREIAKQLPDLIYNLAKDEWTYPIKMHYNEITRELINEMMDDGLVED